MSLPTSHTLDVPGACLYYEVQGSGPALMLVGHPMGASGLCRHRSTARRGLHRRDLRPPRLCPQHDRRPRPGRRAGPAGRRRAPGARGGRRRARARVRQQRWRGHGARAWSPATPATCKPSSPTSPRSPCSCRTPRRRAPGCTTSTTPTAKTAPAPRGRGSPPLPASTCAPRVRTPRHSRRRPRRWPRASASSVTACCRSRSTSRTSPPFRPRRPGSWSPGGPPPRASSLAHGCRAWRTPRHAAGRLPRGPRRFRQRRQGLRRRPPPHPGIAPRDEAPASQTEGETERCLGSWVAGHDRPPVATSASCSSSPTWSLPSCCRFGDSNTISIPSIRCGTDVNTPAAEALQLGHDCSRHFQAWTVD